MEGRLVGTQRLFLTSEATYRPDYRDGTKYRISGGVSTVSTRIGGREVQIDGWFVAHIIGVLIILAVLERLHDA